MVHNAGMKKQILIVGNYGAGNVGDDLLCLAAVKGLRTQFPEFNLAILAASPNEIKSFDYLDLEAEAIGWLFPTGFRSWMRAIFRLELWRSLRFVRESEFVIFSGGGLLNAQVPRSFLVWGAQLFWIKFVGKPIAALGQSFPELNLSKRASRFKSLLKKFDFVSARDPLSYQVLQVATRGQQLITKEVADLAFSLNSEDYIYEAKKQDRLALNFRFYKGLPAEELLEFAKRTYQFLIRNTDYKLEFVCLDDADFTFAQELMKRLPESERLLVTKFKSVPEVLDAFAKVRGVLSMRLHGLILALMNDSPLFSFSYNDKNLGLLRKVGLEVAQVNLQEELNLSEPEFVSRLQKFLRQIQQQDLNPSIDIKKELGAEAELNYSYLRGWYEAI